MCNMTAHLTLADSGRAVSLNVGEGFQVELEELASSGYVWQSQVAPEGVLRLATSERKSAGDGMGAAMQRTMTFCAEQPGTANIQLEMRRPWEAQGSATKTFHIAVTVK